MADTIKEVKKNYDNARELLLPKHAEQLAYNDSPLWSMAELTRIYKNIPEKQYEECVEYANQYVDPKNTLNVRRWVDDPQVGETTYPGRWRLVRNLFDKNKPNNQGMTQVLRRGFARAISWDEALLVDIHDLQEAERYMLVILPNFDPMYLEAATTALRATPYLTDPTIQSEQRTGTWEAIHIKPEKQEDGSVWIKVFFGVPRYTLTTFDNINTPKETDITYLWNVPKRLAQALVTSYRTGTGTSAIANYATDQGLVDITIRTKTAAAIITFTNIKSEDGCLEISYDDYYFGLTKAQAEAFDIGTASQGWNYKLLSLNYSADGYYEAHVRRSQAQTKTISARVVQDDANSSISEARYINATTAPASVSASAGEKKWIRNLRLNGFCYYDYDLDTETVKDVEATSYEVCTGFTTTAILSTHDTTPLALPTAEAGTVKNYDNRPDGYGKYTTQKADKVINDISGGRIYRKLQNMTVVGTFITGAVSAPADPTGYGELSARQELDGRYYGQKTDITYDDTGYVETPWVSYDRTQTFRQHAVNAGVRQYRDVTLTFNQGLNYTSGEAYSAIAGGMHGTNVQTLGQVFGFTKFLWTKVTAITNGAWQNDV